MNFKPKSAVIFFFENIEGYLNFYSNIFELDRAEVVNDKFNCHCGLYCCIKLSPYKSICDSLATPYLKKNRHFYTIYQI